jgi:hypothetical protein
LLNRSVEETTNSLIKSLIKKASLDDIADQLKKNVFNNVKKDVIKDCSTSIEQLNVFLEKTFSIPDYVVLAEHEVMQANDLNPDEFKQLEQECAELEKSCKQNKILMAQLSEEMRTYDNLKDFFSKTADVIERSDAALETPIEEDRLKNVIEKLNEMLN